VALIFFAGKVYINKTATVTITAMIEVTISDSLTCSFVELWLNNVVIFFIIKF